MSLTFPRDGSRRFPAKLYVPWAFFTKQSPFDILCCRRQPRVLLLRVCFCLAKEIPRDRRVHRQLHIDRILQNRQFRSATYITAAQICQSERKTVDSRVTRHVLFCFRSRICNNTLSRIMVLIVTTYRLAKEFIFCRFFINIFKLLKHRLCHTTSQSILPFALSLPTIARFGLSKNYCESNRVKLHATP